MKKIIFSAAVLAMAAIGAIKATQTNDYAFNELTMENIEMLAQAESGYGVHCKFICVEIGCAWTDLEYVYCGGMSSPTECW